MLLVGFYYENVPLIFIFMYSRHKAKDSVLVGYDTAAKGNRFSTFRMKAAISN